MGYGNAFMWVLIGLSLCQNTAVFWGSAAYSVHRLDAARIYDLNMHFWNSEWRQIQCLPFLDRVIFWCLSRLFVVIKWLIRYRSRKVLASRLGKRRSSVAGGEGLQHGERGRASRVYERYEKDVCCVSKPDLPTETSFYASPCLMLECLL